MHPLEQLAKDLGFHFAPIGRYWHKEGIGRSIILFFTPENVPVVILFHEKQTLSAKGEDARRGMYLYNQLFAGFSCPKFQAAT